MIGKTLFVVSAIIALYMSTKARSPMSYASVMYQSSSWGEIQSARKKNQRGKAQRYRHGLGRY